MAAVTAGCGIDGILRHSWRENSFQKKWSGNGGRESRARRSPVARHLPWIHGRGFVDLERDVGRTFDLLPEIVRDHKIGKERADCRALLGGEFSVIRPGRSRIRRVLTS